MTLFNQLQSLESSGLVQLAQAQPELEYLFRHALVQEAAYHSLVKNDRRRLHVDVGLALERAFPDRRAELAPVLAHHFDQAGDAERALRYSIAAADHAAHQYANAEAVLHYGRAISLAGQLPDVSVEQWIHLYLSLCEALRLNGRYAEALDRYIEMERLALGRADRRMELAALVERATIHATPTPVQDAPLGRQLLDRALGLARSLQDRSAESKIYWVFALLYLFSGDSRRAVEHGERSLALARELDLREQLAFTLNDLSNAYMFDNQLDRSLAAAQEARGLWQSLGHLPMLADSTAILCRLQHYAGYLPASVSSGEEALRISRQIRNEWGQSHSLGMLGYPYLELGQVSLALQAWEAALELAQTSGLVAALVGIRADLAWAYAVLGAHERAWRCAELALQATETGMSHWRAWPIAVLARIHLRRNRVVEAEALLREGCAEALPEYYGRLLWSGATTVGLAHGELAIARRDAARAAAVANELLAHLRPQNARVFVPDALFLKGKALLALDRPDDAHAALAEARALVEVMSVQRNLWSICIALSEIEARRGRRDEVESLRRQARESVARLAGQCPPDLQASFLDLPEVRNGTA